MMIRSTFAVVALAAVSVWAQSPIEVTRATYGAGTVHADVTERVRSLVANGGLNIQVNGSTLGVDPVPNTLKTLTVEYSQGFFRRVAQAKDFETMRIGNVPAEILRVTKALYGDGRRMKDVTDILNRRVSNNQLELAVTNDNLGGDPAPAEKKSIVVDYEFNGRAAQVTLAEGGTLRLPAPGGSVLSGVMGGLTPAGTGSLRIVSATLTADVTSAVAARVVNNAIDLPLNNTDLGPGTGKTLVVEYEMNGQRQTTTVKDGESLRLNVAAPVSTLRIIQAQYGAGRRQTADVTRAVAERVSDNMVMLTVNGANLGGDPAPGNVKTLTVEYEYNGQRRTASARDAETLVIPPVETFNVFLATYGVPGRVIDATRAVTARVADKRLDVPVDGVTLGGDPAPGVVKTLTVEYEINGRRATATARDGQTLRLPGGTAVTTVNAATPVIGGFGGASQSGPCLYRQPNYGGEAVCVNTGQDLATIGNTLGGFRSVKLNGAKSLAVFQQPNFGGSTETFTADIPDLQLVPFAWWRYEASASIQSMRAR